MKNLNKLVALLLAAVMVLGLMPTMTIHAHAAGIEDYPAIALDTAAAVEITEGGAKAYFTFTPEVTDLYHFYSMTLEGGYTDTYGHLYDADMNELATNDDASYPYAVEGVMSPNFCLSYVLEAGVTYVFAARLYGSYSTGSFQVVLTQGHEYESAVTKENTCAEDGILTYTCKHCGESYEEAIPAAHTYSEETGECIHCGEAYLITGTCGDDLTWSLDWFGKLTISGTGTMYNYTVSYSESYPAPWYNEYNNDIKTVVVEEGVTSVGNYAFYQCGNLTEVTLADSVTTLGTATFNNCYALTSVKLSDSITAIPDYCFNYCGLTEIDWPANLTSIGSNAFSGCAFDDLVIPEGVTTIGQSAFRGCSSIGTLTLPTTLTELSNYAFDGMWNAKEYIFKGNAPTFGSNTFNYVNATVWYPLGNETWTEDIMQNYGGTLTWKGICSGSHTWSQPVTVEATCETGSYMTMTCTVCGYVTNSPENDDALGHDYQTEHYDGGCGNSSYDIITCSRCDYYSTENYVWNEHSYESTTVAPTCTTDGYDVYTCSICGDNYQTNFVPASGHSVDEWSEPTEATCTEPSVKTGTCSICGETATEEVSPALGHEWDEENGVANDDGSVTYSCVRCDATYTTEGTSLRLGDNIFSIAGSTGRNTKTFTAEADGTLTITMNQMFYHNAYAWENGWIDQYWQPLAIDWAFSEGFFNIYINDVLASYSVEGSETAANIIFNTIEVNAGDVVEVEVNHLESSYQYEYDIQFNMNLALETAEPEPEYPALVLGDNEFSLADNTESAVHAWTAEADGTLTVKMTSLSMYFYGFWSEEPVGSQLEDRAVSFKVNGESVFTADGTTLDVKTGDVVTVQVGNYSGMEIKAIVTLSLGDSHEHSYTAVVTEPTCTEAGYTTYTCECGDSYTADEVPALGHTEEVIPATEPTFDKVGLTEGKHCSVCGEILTAQETIPMLDYNEGIVPVEVLTATAGDFYSSDVPANVLDDDYATMWHTHWYGTSDANHWIQFELSESYAVDGLRYKPRTDLNRQGELQLNGTITTYKIQVSNDGVTFTDVTEGNWDANSDWKTVEFDAQTVKFIRLVSVEACTDNQYVFASAAEIRLTGLKSDEQPHEHTPAEAVKENEVAPTCTEDGSYDSVVYCSECNEEISRETVTVPATGHTEEVIPAVDPTCTETGLTEGKKCAVCGVTLVEQVEIPALGHDWKGVGCTRCDATRENPFVDVPNDSYCIDPVLWAVEKGITKGTDDTHFDPEGKCARAFVVTFLWRAAGSPEPETTVNPFTDVKEGDFFYKAVLWAVEEGITKGTSDTTFNPSGICIRAEVITFLWRYMGEPEVDTESGFSDVVAGAWYEAPINWAVEAGVTNGMGDGTFGAAKTCTRAQVVTFLYRAMAD